MSNGLLSQEEIDALLSGQGLAEDEVSADQDVSEPDTGLAESAVAEDAYVFKNELTPLEKDALGEIGNMSMGSAATVLSQLVNDKVQITTPVVSIVNNQKIREQYILPYLSVVVGYTEGLTGSNMLVFDLNDAASIVDLLMGGDGINATTEFDEVRLSAISEIMNQMMGSAATSMSTLFNRRIDISPPQVKIFSFAEQSPAEIMNIPDTEMVQIKFDMHIGDLIHDQMMLLLPVEFAKEMVANLSGDSGASAAKKDEPAAAAQPAPTPQQAPQQQQMPQQGAYPQYPPQQQQPMAAAPMQGYQQQAYMMPPQMYQMPQQPMQNSIPVQPVQFQPLQQMQHQEMPRNIDMILDVPMQVTVELGRTRKLIRDILELNKGSIIELDKLAGEPVDILVNGKLVARGEVVVIDENFGVRVTDIVSPVERVANLN